MIDALNHNKKMIKNHIIVYNITYLIIQDITVNDIIFHISFLPPYRLTGYVFMKDRCDGTEGFEL